MNYSTNPIAIQKMPRKNNSMRKTIKPKQRLSHKEEKILHSKTAQFVIIKKDKQGLKFNGFESYGFLVYEHEYDKIVCTDIRNNVYQFKLIKNDKIGLVETIVREDLKTVYFHEDFNSEFKTGNPEYWKWKEKSDDLPRGDDYSKDSLSHKEEKLPILNKAQLGIIDKGKRGLKFGGWKGTGFSIYEPEYDEIACFDEDGFHEGCRFSRFKLSQNDKIGFSEVCVKDDNRTVYLHEYFSCEYDYMFIFSRYLYLFFDINGCRYFNYDEENPPDKPSCYYKYIIIREYRLEGEENSQKQFPWGKKAPANCLHEVKVCTPWEFEFLWLNPIEFAYDGNNRLVSHRRMYFEILFLPQNKALEVKVNEPCFYAWTEHDPPPPDDGLPLNEYVITKAEVA